jgi:hypothetical protein
MAFFFTLGIAIFDNELHRPIDLLAINERESQLIAF